MCVWERERERERERECVCSALFCFPPTPQCVCTLTHIVHIGTIAMIGKGYNRKTNLLCWECVHFFFLHEKQLLWCSFELVSSISWNNEQMAYVFRVLLILLRTSCLLEVWIRFFDAFVFCISLSPVYSKRGTFVRMYVCVCARVRIRTHIHTPMNCQGELFSWPMHWRMLWL